MNELPKQVEMSLNATSLPKSSCLGVLGIPGLSAYLGLVQVCKAKAGETVVISSAAGQIGHLAGQIAKILGLTVIGISCVAVSVCVINNQSNLSAKVHS